MDQAELTERTTRLSDQLDAEGISYGDQAAICGALLTASLLLCPREELHRRVRAHIATFVKSARAMGVTI